VSRARVKKPARGLTHVDARGQARMVDVGDKAVTAREARAEARVRMARATMDALAEGQTPKGDVLATVRIAAIQAAKRCHELIPLCHVLPLDAVRVEITLDREEPIATIEVVARTHAKTGVEMEALTAASVAALTLYDMLKAIDRGMEIERVRLLEKRGGKSGTWRREADDTRAVSDAGSGARAPRRPRRARD
jgi:cyclic pyranopterin phosphate synthase